MSDYDDGDGDTVAHTVLNTKGFDTLLDVEDYDQWGVFIHPEPLVTAQRHDAPDEFMGIRLVH